MAIDAYLAVAAASAALCLVFHLLLRHFLRQSPSRLPLPPGPRGFPILGALLLVGPRAHADLARLANRYGPLMFLRLGSQNCVVASKADAARTFLTTFDLQFANRPDPISTREISYNRQNLVMADYTPRWKLIRKMCNLHILGGKALADWAAVRRDELAHMVLSLRDLAEAGKPVELPDVLVCALANILGMLLVSRRVFDTHGEESNKFKETVLEMLTDGAQFNIGDFFPSIGWMDLQGVQAKLRSVRVRFDAMMTKLFEEHEATKKEREGRPDFLDKMMAMANRATTEDGETITHTNIKALIIDLFIAGSDTSATVVEWGMAEMLKNPAILKRAQAETDAVIGRDRLLEESDLPKLTYLQAICKEALRLHASTPLSVPHFSYDECEVNGYYIPKNTRLIVNIWAIGRDPDVWEDPLVFDPDRFVVGGKGAKYDPQGNDFEFLPFGAGRRICNGKLAAMVFVQYMLGTLVHSFDWRLPEGEELNMDEKCGITIPKAVPLKAFLTPRLSPAAYVI